MKIWIDADACPNPAKDIVIRATLRLKIITIFVAAKSISIPETDLIVMHQVTAGPDAADCYIVDNAVPGDLVVTQDIPLAALLVPKGVTVISPRGTSYNADNIADHLSRRDLMQELRDTGAMFGGPKPFDDRHKRIFAQLLDSSLTRLIAMEKRTARE